MAEPRELTGWGRTAPTSATLRPVASRDEVVDRLAGAGPRGAIARGLGRSYNDAAQSAGGDVLDTTAMAGVLHFDVAAGRLRAQAGLSLDRLLRLVLPFGWFVPVTPGTRFVTLGGALAADIHGKNHHVDGGFARHVHAFELVLADGSVRQVTPQADPDVFWATAGGMGLTGTVTEIEVQLRPVTTSRMRVDTDRVGDLDALLAVLAGREATYSVAWIDLAATGARTGRGVATFGEHAGVDELDAADRADPLAFDPRTRLATPDLAPDGLLNPLTVRAFNELWFRKAPRRRRDEIQPAAAYFHPLDGVADWNRLYGPRGFVQYQLVVPDTGVDALRDVVSVVSTSAYPSFLAVLKRLGPASPGMLSFPMAGWTLAMDFPVREGLDALLARLDELVLAAGGRLYLAKDGRMRPDHLAAMYPRLEQFRAVRERLDPDRRLCSDLARRLHL